MIITLRNEKVLMEAPGNRWALLSLFRLTDYGDVHAVLKFICPKS